ncbi:MAG TPA: MBL fold metallo-hydrolase [Chitinophaga sp.]|uniref:MBL fold metallo-hydrolase n=1 Tax=Chitinophaga sp. TaxID=1869181 RepID=UPI002B91C5E9|nr:MBL fold metallo-hydrolase [Chitinophaga sp.]HVI44047.1 MBL fold metallo-hydrolase [Chitinophaga sp.]
MFYKPANKERLQQSHNFRDGAFQNLTLTPMKPEGVSYYRMIKDALNKPEEVRPPVMLPSVRTDLKAVHSAKPVITWFGHSSYLIQINSMNIMVDPVFSGSAAPFSFMVKAFPGADVYTVADMPPIDILIITHNHYDHLDKKTLRQLLPSVKAVYTPLGVGSDLQVCGSHPVPVEMDWWDDVEIMPEVSLGARPARHFSGRGLKRGGSLWASFLLNVYGYTIYLGGDSGYDTHFKAIGKAAGSIDLAILECGQYNDHWPFIHMKPEETVQAAIDLGAKVLMPVHWAKFALATHAWNEPPIRVTKYAAERGVAITTPMIGEPVIVGESYPQQQWWYL